VRIERWRRRTLEKLVAYEAVNASAHGANLKNRLDSDRRCFAFFHPRMPEEPLISSRWHLSTAGRQRASPARSRARRATRPANTAIFYSISNCSRAGRDQLRNFDQGVAERLA